MWRQVAGYGNKYLRKNGEQTRVTAQQVEDSVNGSLSRLGTDHIDLLQVLHCFHRERQGQLVPEGSGKICKARAYKGLCVVPELYALQLVQKIPSWGMNLLMASILAIMPSAHCTGQL